jgi:hypothetical protein
MNSERHKRALAYPRAFSVMVGELTGKVVDALRVLSSTKTYRASVGDVTRELIAKGMAVEAAEYALTFATGKPVDLCTGLIGDVHKAMGKEFAKGLPGLSREEVLHAVLSRMWPDIVQAVDEIDTQSPGGKAYHRKLLAGPPVTRLGRPETSQQIRARALAELASGEVQAPKLLPPRDVQEARAQARTQQAADRLAVERGVPVSDLLAGTPGGKALGLRATDETAAATGWAPDAGQVPKGTPGGGTRPDPDAAQPSIGEQLKQARKGLRK